MSSEPSEVIVAGSTGLCGSAFVRNALKNPLISKVWSFSRSDPPFPEFDKLEKVVSPSTDSWKTNFPSSAATFISGVATTRAAAGGLEKQKLIEHDLQLDLAVAAKEKGCKTAILISSSGASSSSMFAYLKMKGQIEEDFVKLGFEKTIILRPGFLLGERAKAHNGFGGSLARFAEHTHRSVFQSLLMYPIYGDEVAIGALKLAETLPNGVHYISSKELLEVSESQK